MICSIRVQMSGRKWVLSEVPLWPIVSHSVCVPRSRMFTKCKKQTQGAHSTRRTLGQARRCMICNLYITVQSRVTARGRLFLISFPACCSKETHTNYNNCAIISTQIVIILVKGHTTQRSVSMFRSGPKATNHYSFKPAERSFGAVLCVLVRVQSQKCSQFD